MRNASQVMRVAVRDPTQVMAVEKSTMARRDAAPNFVGGEEDPRRRDYHGRDEQRGGLLDEREGFAPPKIRR